jgi:hypothetical protein
MLFGVRELIPIDDVVKHQKQLIVMVGADPYVSSVISIQHTGANS